MPMKMGWRWYGEDNDPITLSDIKQIPGVTSIVWALHNKMPGEIWEIDEIQKVAVWDYEDLKDMCDMDAVKAFRERALNPSHPTMRGSHENGDIFFQNREASNKYYDAIPEIVEEYMGKVNEKLGTDYKLFNYYGAPDADRVIVAMGSICDVAEEVIDYLTAQGEKVGLVKVRLFLRCKRRPRHSGHRRPLRPRLEGHSSCLRLCRLQRA